MHTYHLRKTSPTKDTIFNTPFKILSYCILAVIWKCDEFNDTLPQYWQAHKKTAF